MITASDLQEMLRNHYISPTRPSAGYFSSELVSPEGNRRADAVWLPLTHNDRGRIIGHEIKVSRADILAELSDPTKADAWARYCDEWWLVVADPELLTNLAVPAHWGVMSPPSGRARRSMTILKPAPALKPTDKAVALAVIMTRLFFGGDDAAAVLAEVTADRDLWKSQVESAREQRDEALAKVRAAGMAGTDEKLVGEVMVKLGELRQESARTRFFSRPNSADIATTIFDIERGRELARQLVGNIEQVARLGQDIAHRFDKPLSEIAALRDEVISE